MSVENGDFVLDEYTQLADEVDSAEENSDRLTKANEFKEVHDKQYEDDDDEYDEDDDDDDEDDDDEDDDESDDQDENEEENDGEENEEQNSDENGDSRELDGEYVV